MIVLDASIWIGWLLTVDAHHLETDRWLTTYLDFNGTIAAPMLLLPEVVGALARRTSNIDYALEAGNDLQHFSVLSLITLDDDLMADSASLAATLRLRGADAVYVAVARQLGVPLVTWDREQLSHAASVVTVYTPATAPLSS